MTGSFQLVILHGEHIVEEQVCSEVVFWSRPAYLQQHNSCLFTWCANSSVSFRSRSVGGECGVHETRGHIFVWPGHADFVIVCAWCSFPALHGLGRRRSLVGLWHGITTHAQTVVGGQSAVPVAVPGISKQLGA